MLPFFISSKPVWPTFALPSRVVVTTGDSRRDFSAAMLQELFAGYEPLDTNMNIFDQLQGVLGCIWSKQTKVLLLFWCVKACSAFAESSWSQARGWRGKMNQKISEMMSHLLWYFWETHFVYLCWIQVYFVLKRRRHFKIIEQQIGFWLSRNSNFSEKDASNQFTQDETRSRGLHA